MDYAHPDMPTMLLVNPASRRGAKAFTLYQELLAQRVHLVNALLTRSQDHMLKMIQDGLNTGIQRFVIGGGDGTLSAAADALVLTPGIMGVIPLGTGNTFSHGLGLPRAIPQLADILANGPIARYDVGLAITGDQQKIFLNSLTMGFSEKLVELLSRQDKDRLGLFAWIIEFRRALTRTPVLNVQLRWKDREVRYMTRQLVVVNGRTIAAGITATPASSGQDGLLEVFRLGGPSLISIVRLGVKLLTGRLLADHEAHYLPLTEVTVETTPTQPVNIDGEIWNSPPITCRVIPGALNVITPSEDGQSPRRWPLVTQTLGPMPLMPRLPSRLTGHGARHQKSPASSDEALLT